MSTKSTTPTTGITICKGGAGVRALVRSGRRFDWGVGSIGALGGLGGDAVE